jgi:hypothetical protein
VTPIDNLAERLAGLNDDWQDAKTFSRNWPPDGDYQALVHRFDFFEGGENNHAYLKTELEVQHDDDWHGTIVETIHDLEDPDRLGFLKQHLQTLGLELDSFSDLENRLSEVLDVPVAIRIKTSDKTDNDGNNYRNAYVNERLGGPIGSDVPPDTAGLPVDEPDFAPNTPIGYDPEIGF